MVERKPRSSKKLVIFDLDGTLVELPIDYSSLRRELEEKLQLNFESIFPTVRGLEFEQKREAFEIIDRYELAAADKIKIRDGAEKALQDSKIVGLAISIVTLQGSKAAKNILHAIGITSLVDLVVTREDSVYREEQISMVLKRLGFLPTDTIVIGDKIDDYDAASRLGCDVFLVRKLGNIPYCSLNELNYKISA